MREFTEAKRADALVDARADVPVENLVRKNAEREKRAEKTFSGKGENQSTGQKLGRRTQTKATNQVCGERMSLSECLGYFRESSIRVCKMQSCRKSALSKPVFANRERNL